MEIEWAGQILQPTQVSTVIYRRPQPFEPPIKGDLYQRQHAATEWAEALEGFLSYIPFSNWINHPTSNFIASHKLHQLRLAHSCGLSVPNWSVTTVPDRARRFLEENGPDIIAKPLASGYIERERPEDDTLIYTQLVNETHSDLFDRLPACPVLFQERIKKIADVRLVVVDKFMVAIRLEAKEVDGSQRLDVRRNNMRDVSYASIKIPLNVANSIRTLMQTYQLRFAAIDFAIDHKNSWIFFEINPNGQWAWLDLVGASDMAKMFIDTIQSSVEHVNDK